MSDIKSKPASREYRDGWDRTFRPRTLAEAERVMTEFMGRALESMGVVTRQSPYGLDDCLRCNGYGKTLETEITEVDSELVWRDCPECSR